LGVAQSANKDIRHSDGFGSRNPKWFFAYFFAIKKVRSGAMNSTKYFKEKKPHQSQTRASPLKLLKSRQNDIKGLSFRNPYNI